MYKVVLKGGSPWGFRLEDGTGVPGKTCALVQVAKLSSNSKAHDQGIQIGDTIQAVNGRSVAGMTSSEVMQLVRGSSDVLSLELFRGKPASDDGDVYSSGYSSKGSNQYVSLSTLSSASLSTSNLTLDQPLSQEDRASRPATIGRESVKSYRPVLFDVSNGVGNTKTGDKFTSGGKILSHLEPDYKVNPPQNMSAHSAFSAKESDTISDLDHWNSSMSHASEASLPTTVSYSGDSNLYLSKVTLGQVGNSDPDRSPVGSVSTSVSRLPVAQNPTITLLQKKRVEGNVPRSASSDNELFEGDRFKSRLSSRASRVSNSLDAKDSQNVFHKYQSSESSLPVNWEKESFNRPSQIRVNGVEDTNGRFEVGRDKAGAEKADVFSDRSSISSLQNFKRQSFERSDLQPNHRYTGSGGFDSEPDDVKVEKRLVKFEGIGPVDEKTGIPIATRSSLDTINQKDWYRRMYKSMHTTEQGQESNYVFPGKDDGYDNGSAHGKSSHATTFTIRKVTPDEKYASTPSLTDPGTETSKAVSTTYKPDISKSFALQLANSNSGSNQPSISSRESSDVKVRQLSLSPRNQDVKTGRLSTSPAFDAAKSGQMSAPSSPRKKSNDSWTVAHYKYENQPYRVQPRSIEDYEPGHSSALLSGSEKLYSSFSNAPIGEESSKPIKRSGGRNESNFRPFWKSMSSLDQESGRTEKEAVHPNVGGNRQNTWVRKVDSPLEKHDNVSNASLKTNTNNSSHRWQPEAKNGHLQSHSHSHSGSNESRKLQDVRGFDNGPVRHNQSSHPLGLQNSRNGGIGPISSAKVLHTFRAQSPSDLSIYEGDVVNIFRHIDENWCEGESNGKIGKFPLNFVKIQSPSGDEFVSLDSQKFGKAIAIYDFNAQTSLELSFRKNEELTLVSQINNDWFEGRIGGQSGFVPANYIKVVKEPDSSLSPKNISTSQRQDNFNPLSKSSNEFSSLHPNHKLHSNSTSGVGSFDSAIPPTTKSHHPGDPSARLFSDQPGYYSEDSRAHRKDNAVPEISKFPNGRSLQTEVGLLGSLSSGEGVRVNNNPAVGRSPQDSAGFHKPGSRFAEGVGKPGSNQTATVWPTSNQTAAVWPTSNQTTAVWPTSNQTAAVWPTSNQTAAAWPTSNQTPAVGPIHRTSQIISSSRPDINLLGNSKYVTVFAYNPRRADELELNKGDIVYVIEKYDDGWFVGMSERTKKMGTFPGNYVQTLS